MNITLRSLLEADIAALRAAAARWLQVTEDIDDAVADLGVATGDLPHHWTGADAVAAQQRVATLRMQIGNVHQTSLLVAFAIRNFANDLENDQRMLQNIVAEARGQGLTIDLVSGTVTAPLTSPLASVTPQQAQAGVDAYVAQIDEVVERARASDAKARQVLDRYERGKRTEVPSDLHWSEAMSELDQSLFPTWDAYTQASVWHGLHPMERDRVIAEQPEVFGAAEGVASDDRDRANRILLARERSSLVEQQTTLSQAPGSTVAPTGYTETPYQQLATVNTRIAAIDKLQSRMDDPGKPRAYLVDYRPGNEADTTLSPGGAEADSLKAGLRPAQWKD